MKKRILCLVLVLAMLLPIQVFAAGAEIDNGSDGIISIQSTIEATKYISDVVIDFVYPEPVTSTIEYYDRDGFSGTLKLYMRNDVGKVTYGHYRGTVYKYIET
ncbi:MAG: hypothetical protein ACYDG2_10235 [Ruminiclostridium sp.]